MKGDDQLYQEIERYLKGDLKGEEKTAFEQKLAVDSELQKRVELSKLANNLVIENRLLNVKEVLRDVHNNTRANNLGRNIVLGLAGLLVVGGTALYLLNNKEKNTIQDTSTENTSKIIVTENNSQQNNNGSEVNKNTINKRGNFTTTQGSTVVAEESQRTKDSVLINLPQNITQEKEVTVTKESTPAPQVQQPIVPVNPCENIYIKAKVTTTNPCEDEENGSITISDIKNGNAPYALQLKDSKGHELYSYNSLKVGSYSVDITDSKGCSQELTNISITAKKCSKDYAFNPYVGEVWQIPVSDNSGTLTIYDKTGSIYLQKELNAGTHETWDGYSQNGELKVGYFIFTISYNNGTVVNGSVTTTR